MDSREAIFKEFVEAAKEEVRELRTKCEEKEDLLHVFEQELKVVKLELEAVNERSEGFLEQLCRALFVDSEIKSEKKILEEVEYLRRKASKHVKQSSKEPFLLKRESEIKRKMNLLAEVNLELKSKLLDSEREVSQNKVLRKKLENCETEMREKDKMLAVLREKCEKLKREKGMEREKSNRELASLMFEHGIQCEKLQEKVDVLAKECLEKAALLVKEDAQKQKVVLLEGKIRQYESEVRDSGKRNEELENERNMFREKLENQQNHVVFLRNVDSRLAELRENFIHHAVGGRMKS